MSENLIPKIVTQILVALLLFTAAVLFWIYVIPELVEHNEVVQSRYGVSTKMDGGVLAIFSFVLFGCVSMICSVVNIFQMRENKKRISRRRGAEGGGGSEKINP